jgi:cell division protein FtsZ
MGVGEATGRDKAEAAAKAAISSPLLETSIGGAHGILVSITASPDIGLEDVDRASTMIAQEAAPDANIIWGAAFDPELEDEMRVTVIATGFDNAPKSMQDTVESQLKKEAEAAPEKAAAVEAPKAEEAPKAAEVEKPKKKDELISDDDFNELLGLFKDGKR